MSAAIKNDPEITGVKINDSEYLLSQYADDSSLILDDNPKSLDQSLFMFNTFSECAGLRVNFVEIYSVSAEKIISDAFSYSENV